MGLGCESLTPLKAIFLELNRKSESPQGTGPHPSVKPSHTNQSPCPRPARLVLVYPMSATPAYLFVFCD